MNELTLVLLGVAALLMRLGTTLYLAGMCRAKNAGGAIFRAIADFAVAVIAVWAVGDAILRGDVHLLFGWASVDPALAIVIAVTLIATGIIVGAALERARFLPLLSVAAITAAIVVPVGWQWAWGWMSREFRFIDVGGASFLHCAGAVIGLVAIKFIGPRLGKYNHDGSANVVPGHNVPLAAAGALLIAIGFFPCLLGMAALRGESIPLATADLFCAAAAGALAGMFLAWYRFSPGDNYLVYCGMLGGMVAVCGCAGRINTPSAVALGAVAGIIVPLMSIRLELNFRIDDPSALVAIHGVGGALGTIAAGLSLADHGILGRIEQVGKQIVCLAAIIVFAGIVATATFYLLARATKLRLSEADETDGADLAEHDLNSYPDFQQTMIKSYHLRET